ncbi:hypothetical protein PK98_14940 [Croceibacterium mercuriale]|uniref:Conjugal transfer protein TrbI n=1 Tax=Croceibacterium mercuriale TaxID=1572751 RepID=A0A0B2BSA3_9SPHN|nr:TrbI F-type domain-containing protein [Croceibacterium mercuriale]KHL24264.1 hypothetical protein PK98_14940 [Croceibacterium mercuriale]
MADLHDADGEASTPVTTTAAPHKSASPATTGRRKAPARSMTFAGFDRQQLILLVAAIALLAWGAWVTKTLTRPAANHDFVQLELQGIIGDYLQAQARSGNDERTAAQQTAVFMAKLDEIVGSYAADGKVVLVHQAIIGGELPDITEAVKAEAYAAAPLPAAPGPGGVAGEMRAYMQGSGPVSGTAALPGTGGSNGAGL